MKAFIKTVSLTLCISVTMLFFSSFKKVEAAGAGAAVAIEAGLYIIAAIATGIASCLTVEVIIELNEFVESNYFADSFTKDDEGLFSYHPLSDNQQMDAVVEAAVAQYNNKVKNNEISSNDTSSSLSSESYSDCVSSGLKDVLGSGAASGIITGISTIDGKPQKVITTDTPTMIEAFDYLDLSYISCTSLFDFTMTFQLKDDVMGNNCYYRPYFIKDNILYILYSDTLSADTGIFHSVYSSRYNNNVITLSGSFGEYLTTGKYGTGATDEFSSYAFKFANVDSSLCLAFFSYNSGYNLYNNTCNNPSRLQTIYGYPYSPSSYPVLFNTPDHDYNGKITSTFNNYPTSSPFLFVNPVDTSLQLSESDILGGSYDSCGYLWSENSAQLYGGETGTLGTASKMMSGTEGSAVSGGSKTTYSDLSDIEKAIYALARQQGITYEQMLEQCNIVIENGEMYIEGMDGVKSSIDSLIAQFDKLIEQGTISNEQGVLAGEQLAAILEYLKSLNVAEVSQYVMNIESILDDMREKNITDSEFLSSMVDQLQNLNDYLSTGAISSDVAQIRTKTEQVADILKEIKEGHMEDLEKINKAGIFLGGFITPFVSHYNLYEQCKYLIEKVFNYDDINIPPDFSFFWDSDGDGIKERYTPLDLSFLEMTLTNENLADKSWFIREIKVIDFIRYLLALVIYGFFIMRLIKRLPTFYGLGPLSRSGG